MPSNASKTSRTNDATPKAAFTVPQVTPSRRRDEDAQPEAPAAESPSGPAGPEQQPTGEPTGLVPTTGGSARLPGRPVPPQHEDVPIAPLDASAFTPPPAQPLMIRTTSDVISLRVDAPDAAWFKRVTKVAAGHYEIPEGVIPRIIMMMLKENMPEIIRQSVFASKGVDIGPQ